MDPVKRQQVFLDASPHRDDYNEVSISVDVQTRWQINFFQAYLEEANLLKTGDIIWLNHSEKNATLAHQKREEN